MDEVGKILEKFGVERKTTSLSFPEIAIDSARTDYIKAQMTRSLEIVELSGQRARREVLIAPLLLNASRLTRSRLSYIAGEGYSDEQADYLIEGRQRLLVKVDDDLAEGFSQLCIRMIALAERDSIQKSTYGAVTVGEVWQFGIFDSQKQQMTQDISLYNIPEDVDRLLPILVGILNKA